MSASSSDRKGFARINTATIGDNTIIAAPSKGHIEIDHINILPSGGTNTITLKSGSTTKVDYALDDNQALALDIPVQNELALAEAEALVLNLSAATLVTGFVLYRIVGE